MWEVGRFPRGLMTKVSNASSIALNRTIDNREDKACEILARVHVCSLCVGTRASYVRHDGVCLSTCSGARTIFAVGNRTMVRHTAARAWPTCRSYMPMRNTRQLAGFECRYLAHKALLAFRVWKKSEEENLSKSLSLRTRNKHELNDFLNNVL